MFDSRDDSSMGTTLLTFLLGLAVGATVAILYAPAAGTETRAQIADKAGQLKDKASDLKNQVAERAGEWKDKAANMIQRAGDQAADTADSAASSAQRVADTVRSEANNAGRG